MTDKFNIANEVAVAETSLIVNSMVHNMVEQTCT
jgi:hypothetical protein